MVKKVWFYASLYDSLIIEVYIYCWTNCETSYGQFCCFLFPFFFVVFCSLWFPFSTSFIVLFVVLLLFLSALVCFSSWDLGSFVSSPNLIFLFRSAVFFSLWFLPGLFLPLSYMLVWQYICDHLHVIFPRSVEILSRRVFRDVLF